MRPNGHTYAGRFHETHAFAAGSHHVEHALLALDVTPRMRTYRKQIQRIWNLLFLRMQIHNQTYAQTHGIQHPEVVANQIDKRLVVRQELRFHHVLIFVEVLFPREEMTRRKRLSRTQTQLCSRRSL